MAPARRRLSLYLLGEKQKNEAISMTDATEMPCSVHVDFTSLSTTDDRN